jgi:hypothetical protein
MLRFILAPSWQRKAASRTAAKYSTKEKFTYHLQRGSVGKTPERSTHSRESVPADLPFPTLCYSSTRPKISPLKNMDDKLLDTLDTQKGKRKEKNGIINPIEQESNKRAKATYYYFYMLLISMSDINFSTNPVGLANRFLLCSGLIVPVEEADDADDEESS